MRLLLQGMCSIGGMWMEMRKITKAITMVAVLLGILLYLQGVLATGLFYTGGVEIDSIGIRVEVDEKASLKAIYLLTNYGNETEQVNLRFAQCSASMRANGEELHNPIMFKPGESKLINLDCELDVAGKTTKKLFIDPTLLFNGKPNSKPAKALLIKVLLPRGVNKLISASKGSNEEGFEDGRKFYRWSRTHTYPTPLSLIWSTLKLDIDIQKKASPQKITAPDQVIRVEITIKNNGNTSLNNIMLSDQYVASDFEAVEPLEEFSRSESILSWRKRIDSLKPDEAKTLVYSVKYIGFSRRNYNFYLKPCVVVVDGHLASISNRVKISQEGEGALVSPVLRTSVEARATRIRYPSLPTIAIVIFLLAILGGIGYFIRRRRHPK